jgi:hypothetical protein
MKPSEIFQALRSAFKANIPAFIWGAPGAGKSHVIKSAAESIFGPDTEVYRINTREIGSNSNASVVEEFRALMRDVIDLKGLPRINGKGTEFTRPDFLPTEGDGTFVLFLDELNAAPRLVQAGCYELVYDRRVGKHRLPDYVRIVAAGNRQSDRAVTSNMPTPLKSRFMHLDFDVDSEDWLSWAMENNIAEEIIAFISWQPEHLDTFDPASSAERTYACPRTWEYASNLLKAKPMAGIEYAMYEGIIGSGAASSFLGFLRIYRNLPDLDKIIAQPQSHPVATQADVNYAVSIALARRATPDNFSNILSYLFRLSDEFPIIAVKMATKRDKTLKETPAFGTFVQAYTDVII